jgi:hypothetical protein
MAIPEHAHERAERLLTKFAERRVPPSFSDRVRLSVETHGNSIAILEHRPLFHDPDTWTNSPVAQFRYNLGSGLWTLYCDLKGRWQRYNSKSPSADIATLIREVDRDPTCIFWG